MPSTIDRHSEPVMQAYDRLTNQLTNMHGSEKDLFDRSIAYELAMQAMLRGDETRAIQLALSFVQQRGTAWRLRAFKAGVISTPGFVN